VKDAALAMMARAAELDERVDAAGPHRALGAWRAALPVAAGGGAAASRAHFDRASALAPDDQLARVAEAETWAVLVQDEARFESLLEGVLQFDLGRDPTRAPENALARKRAKDLLDRKARLF
jgi:TRAP transporter TatT component family protein